MEQQIDKWYEIYIVDETNLYTTMTRFDDTMLLLQEYGHVDTIVINLCYTGGSFETIYNKTNGIVLKDIK